MPYKLSRTPPLLAILALTLLSLSPVIWAKEPIRTPEQARAWVNENKMKGADGIKFFGAAPEIMDAAIRENKRIGLRSTSHQHAGDDGQRLRPVQATTTELLGRRFPVVWRLPGALQFQVGSCSVFQNHPDQTLNEITTELARQHDHSLTSDG